MAKAKPSPEHFERGHGKVGWVYVARNDMHREDLYKIGYTEQSPESRVLKLNTEQRNRTSQIGFFSLLYACAVFDAQGCEQALFERIGRLRESERKEFVNAPLELIVGELLHIQKRDHQKVTAAAVCQACEVIMHFCPLPQVVHFCQCCGARFQCTPEGRLSIPIPSINRIKAYAPNPDAFLPTRRSPLAEAFVLSQSSVNRYFECDISLDEFVSEIDKWQFYAPPFDRAPPPSKPAPAAKTPRARASKVPTSRKGWMDCPQCLSSVQLDPDDDPTCAECGWPEDAPA